ncbi:hypothetical protein Csa_015514 [Cucumis sativus]|uniref:Uncharacterized protein n=1 Tax=Cucumis sativus TaxID=3659 RepID=A0A0A0K5D0_CUCSA|nr:hypothetical protein Csa_015514 [Cucumis sativus]
MLRNLQTSPHIFFSSSSSSKIHGKLLPNFILHRRAMAFSPFKSIPNSPILLHYASHSPSSPKLRDNTTHAPRRQELTDPFCPNGRASASAFDRDGHDGEADS